MLDRLGRSAKVAVIADRLVADLHAAALLEAIDRPHALLTFPPGESSKRLDQAAALYDELAARRFERTDVIVTLGGGVAGDLGGFVAATWLRGLNYIQVPTTLEAAIDASIGGKTAVNHAAGKNLVGVFHQPSGVIIDTDFLATLPQRDYQAGLAESVKHALIADASFLAWHEQQGSAILSRKARVIEELIARNCRIKAGIVARDEREAGLRMLLNFGHTVGHALEHLLEYELRHGECVALGIVAANALACARGWLAPTSVERVRNLLESLGLPVRLHRAVEAETLLSLCRMDKKVRGGRMRFVLLREVGRPEVANDVQPREVARALQAIRLT